MHNRANPNTDKAAAAQFQRKLVRSRSRRRVVFSTLALFALVFALLSFRLTVGLDPSSSGNTVATTSSQSSQPATTDDSDSSDSSGPGSGDDDEYEYEYDDDDDDEYESSESGDDQFASSPDSATPAPPTSRAS